MKKFKTALPLVLCCFLLLQCLTMGVFAEAELDGLYDEDGFVIWEISDDGQFCYGLGKEFSRYYPTLNIYFDADMRYEFENVASMTPNDYDKLYSYCDDPEILELYFEEAIYVTERGRVSLDALQAGNAASYRLEQADDFYTLSAPMEQELAKRLSEGKETKTFQVSALKEVPHYDLIGYDGTGAYACIYGAVYVVDGAYYYVHYMTLGNNYFDAYGNFSYRSGTVDAVVLDSGMTNAVANTVNLLDYRETEYLYESDNMPVDEDGAIAVFIFAAIVVGFLFPLPFLIVGTCMARSRKRGYPKYWYILTAVAVAWMVVSLIILLILLS